MKSIIITIGLIFLTGFFTLPVLAQNIKGLVAYWSFDEKEGDTASDSSGNEHNGKLRGDPQWTDDGYLGGALEFDQYEDEVNVPYHKDLNPESFTICAWVNLDSDGRGYRSIVSTRYEFPQKGYILYAGPALDGSGNIWQFWTGKGDFWNIVKGPPFSTGKWEHLAAVYANGIHKLYLNGILVGEVSGILHPNLSEELLIGAGANETESHNYFFKGKIDEVQLYNRPLNADEIRTVMGSESSSVKGSDPLVSVVYGVRVIYFRPIGAPPTPIESLTQLMQETQEFYKDQMEYNGYGAKTFRIESNENQEVIIHTVEGKHNPWHYSGNTYEEIEKELPYEFTSANKKSMDNVHVIIVGGLRTVFNGAWGVGWTFSGWQAGGNAVIAGDNLNMPIIAHEIGHAFGLFHNEVNNTMMGPYDGPMLDYEARWLSKSHYLNDIHIRTDIPEFVDFLGTEAIGSEDIIKFKFSAHSDSGLYHSKIIRIRGGFVVLGDDELNGKDDIAEINVPRHQIVTGDKLSFRIMDVNGNYIFEDIIYEHARMLFTLSTRASSTSYDLDVIVGDTFTIYLNTDDITDLAGMQADIAFDPNVLEAVEVTESDFLKSDGESTFFQAGMIDNTVGKITRLLSVRISEKGASGTGTLLSVTFKAKARGETEVALENFEFISITDDVIPAVPPNITITIGEYPAWDGRVSIQDLVLVAKDLASGTPMNLRTDVNSDGVINIQDIILVAQHIGETTDNAAASPLAAIDSKELTPATIQTWIKQAQAEDDGSLAFRQGIKNLKTLLVSLFPEKTALLANYPNPFNPETWIPYQLAAPVDVSISIYAADGKIVRTLALGHKTAGIYQHRSRAAYWDGKNEVGEPVASGLYFYTLTAGDFSATRKMLIRK